MKIRDSWKRVIAASLAVLVVGGAVPADVGFGGLFGGTGIVASAQGYDAYMAFTNGNVTTFNKDDVVEGYEVEEEDLMGTTFNADYVTVKTTSGDVLANHVLSWTADKKYTIMDKQQINHSYDSQYSYYEGANVIEYVFTVEAEPVVQTYPIWVGGEQLSENNLSGEGWSYDVDTNVLTLNNYEYSGAGYKNAGIYANQNLTIELIGDNSITHVADENKLSAGILVSGADLNISGSGTLTANGGNATGSRNSSYGICVSSLDKTLTIYNNATVKANGGNNSAEVGFTPGDSDGVYCGGQLKVLGTLEAKGGIGSASYGVSVYSSMKLNVYGTLTAEAGQATDYTSAGIYATDIGVYPGATVKATGGTSAKFSYGIYSASVLNVNGTLEATGGDRGEGNFVSAGIYYLDFQDSSITVNDTLITKGNDFAIAKMGDTGDWVGHTYTAQEGQEVLESDDLDGLYIYVPVGGTTADTSKRLKIIKPKTFEVKGIIKDGMSDDYLKDFYYWLNRDYSEDVEQITSGPGNEGEFKGELKSGNYDIYVQAPNYESRFISFTVGEDGDYEFDENELRLFKKGDFNGDGKITYRDVMTVVQVANGKKQLNDFYLVNVLDVEKNDDETNVDYKDAMKLVQAAKGKINLWNDSEPV